MKDLTKKFRSYFAAGLVVLAPLFLSIIVIGYLFRMADAFIVNPVFRILPFEIGASFKIFLTKLAIAVVVIVLVTMIGFGARKFLLTNLACFGESILKNIPVFNRIYLVLKEITGALFDDKKGVFKRVVYVEYPRTGIYAIGFVTNEGGPWDMEQKTGKQMVNIFVPSPPNPATGFLALVPKEEVIDAGMSIEEGIKLVISAGAAVPNPTPPNPLFK